MVQTQFNLPIKVLCSDHGGEYTSTAFSTYLIHHAIHHQFSCPHTPEQNGIAEPKNRHLLKTARTLLHHTSLPSPFWLEAASTATYLINPLPTKSLNMESHTTNSTANLHHTFTSKPLVVFVTHGTSTPDKTNLTPNIPLAYSLATPRTTRVTVILTHTPPNSSYPNTSASTNTNSPWPFTHLSYLYLKYPPYITLYLPSSFPLFTPNPNPIPSLPTQPTTHPATTPFTHSYPQDRYPHPIPTTPTYPLLPSSTHLTSPNPLSELPILLPPPSHHPMTT